MAAPHTRSLVVRQQVVKQNEEDVLLLGSISGQRVVSIVRLLVFVAYGVQQGLIHTLQTGVADLPRMIAGLIFTGYALFVVVSLFFFAQPNRRASTVIPLVYTTIDFGFLTYFGASIAMGSGGGEVLRPDRMVASSLLFLSFSLVSFRTFQVLYAAACAMAEYGVVMSLAGKFRGLDAAFVMTTYVGITALIAVMNLRIRRMFMELRFRDHLSRFLPKAVADRVLAEGERALAPIQREVTVLFSDLRDFTALSEHMAPEAVLALLMEYFDHMQQIVQAHDGIVNKFIGDGMLAVWNVPDEVPQHATRAIAAALDMRTKVVELNQYRVQRGEAPLRIGVGIHTGTVAAGMLGGDVQHEYTVIGDAVNVASRIEGLNKPLGTDILVSETTWKQVPEGRFKAAVMPGQTVKGRQEQVVVYALAGAPSAG